MLIAYLLGRASGRRKARRDAERERLLGAMAERQRLRAPEPEKTDPEPGMSAAACWLIVLGAIAVLLVLGALVTWGIPIVALGLVGAYFWVKIFG